jgi:hypothetical protein
VLLELDRTHVVLDRAMYRESRGISSSDPPLLSDTDGEPETVGVARPAVDAAVEVLDAIADRGALDGRR